MDGYYRGRGAHRGGRGGYARTWSRPVNQFMRLDAKLYPHIFHLILQYCSNSALLAVLRVSKAAFEEVAPLLFSHLVLSGGQYHRGFLSMLARRPKTLGPGPHSFISPPNLQRIVFLAITTSGTRLDWPTIKVDLPNLRSLRITHHPCEMVIHLTEAIILPSLDHVIIRAETIDYVNSHLTTKVVNPPKRITLLMSDTSVESESAEDRGIGMFCQNGEILTVLYLPHDLEVQRTSRWNKRYPRILSGIEQWTAQAPVSSTLEIVGLEYGQGQARARISEERWMRACEFPEARYRGPRAKVRFRSFEDWLDEQQPGVTFDRWDGRQFRESAAAMRMK